MVHKDPTHPIADDIELCMCYYYQGVATAFELIELYKYMFT